MIEFDVEPDEPPPSRLGRYRLCFELAAGGMATVYLACVEGEAGFQKAVAIKVVHKHLANERPFIEMFLDEARLSAAIDHPNVCAVFDFGEADGTYYLAMEYLLGETLARIIKEIVARRNPDEVARLPLYAARIFADACEGLHAAHELRGAAGEPLGVVHRDVTPQNLIVTYDGSTKVVDFGVAKATSQLHLTEAGKLKGKLAYVSPEQLQNKPLDRRTDVWSMGVVMWEFLTLKRLFRRDSEAATLMAVAHDEIPRPSTVRRWVRPELDAIVMRALERDIDKRYPNMRELGRDLSAYLTHSRETIGSADVAEWMQAMFAAEREKRLELVRRARALRHIEVVQEVPDALAERSQTGSAVASMSVDVGPAPLGAVIPPARRGGTAWKVAFGGALLALVALIGGAAWTWVQALGGTARRGSTTTSASVSAGAAPGVSRAVADAEPPRTARPAQLDAGAPEHANTPEIVASVEDATTVAVPDAGEPPPLAAASRSAAASVPDRPAERRPRRDAGPRVAASDEPPPPSTSGATGRVHVSASGGGWADVFVDGRGVGRTPVRVVLSVGRHTLRFLPLGEEPAQTQTVDIERGDELLLRLTISNE